MSLLFYNLLHQAKKALQPVIQTCRTTHTERIPSTFGAVVDQNINYAALLLTMVMSPSYFVYYFIELKQQHSYLNYPYMFIGIATLSWWGGLPCPSDP